MPYVEDRTTGKVWIYVLSMMFALVIINILIIPVVNSILRPILFAGLTANLRDTAQVALINTNIDFLMLMVRTSMYFLVFGLIAYAIYAVYIKQRTDYTYG